MRLSFHSYVLGNSCNKYMAYKAFSHLTSSFSYPMLPVISDFVPYPYNYCIEQVWLMQDPQNPFYFCLSLQCQFHCPLVYSAELVLPPTLWRASLNNFADRFQEITLFSRTLFRIKAFPPCPPQAPYQLKEGREEEKREREKLTWEIHQLVASCLPFIGDQASSLSMSPDQDSDWQPLGSWFIRNHRATLAGLVPFLFRYNLQEHSPKLLCFAFITVPTSFCSYLT